MINEDHVSAKETYEVLPIDSHDCDLEFLDFILRIFRKLFFLRFMEDAPNLWMNITLEWKAMLWITSDLLF